MVRKMNAGERIRDLREKRKLKQNELAEMVGLASGTLSAIEKGRNNPTSEITIKLSEFFNVSTDYILTGKEEAATISPDEQEFIKAVRQDSELWNALKETISLKKKAIAQIRMLSQRPMDEQQQAEHA